MYYKCPWLNILSDSSAFTTCKINHFLREEQMHSSVQLFPDIEQRKKCKTVGMFVWEDKNIEGIIY